MEDAIPTVAISLEARTAAAGEAVLTMLHVTTSARECFLLILVCTPVEGAQPDITSLIIVVYNATPILIDAAGQGFHLTDPTHGVQFKFFPNKPPVQISWTDAESSNGWLALDRNRNGLIDNATELFGNLTSQPPSADRNGFIALAAFDDPQNGGNGNGVIDSEDSVYDQLRIWIDKNHNAVGEPEELHTCGNSGSFASTSVTQYPNM